MIALFCSILLGASLLPVEEEMPRGKTAAAIREASTPDAQQKDVHISAERADYDRKSGVILLEENVVVQDPTCTLNADRMYVFLNELNQLTRIVVLGHVAITNGLKNGACERAVYIRPKNQVIMYGSATNLAELVNEEGRRSRVKGTSLTFWTDSEQVEITQPAIEISGGLTLPSNDPSFKSESPSR
jgi:lipopolysaccharide transport protein LptA